MTEETIVEMLEWAEKNKQVPGIVETKEQASAYTKIDKILGINHEWKVGDKFYFLVCPIPKDLK